jgi:glycosyltransferase involved in cell wall biosynthesis
MVGDGELRPALEKLAAEAAPGRVKFLGFRNQSELPALYDLCDVFVLPSAFEPWGLVVNEVMNAGKTVVVSDQVGSGPDLVREGENGSIFPAGDVAALARKLDQWCGNQAAREEAGRKSLEIISKWGFDAVLDGLRMTAHSLGYK